MELDSSLDSLKGIGEKTRKIFEKAGIEDLLGLITHYPRTYERFEMPVRICELREGIVSAVCASLTAPLATRHIRGLSISTALISDGSDVMTATWFNAPYLKNSLQTGIPYVFRGMIKAKGQRLLIEQPAVFSPVQYQGMTAVLHPVYSLVKGLTSLMIQKAVKQVLEQDALIKEYMPQKYRDTYHLAQYNYAIEQIHFPKDQHSLETARRRLVFDEFFFFILQLRSLKTNREHSENSFQIKPSRIPGQLLKYLPYELTGAQMKVWETIERELQQSGVMARLVQGDVGSGKTIVSILALFMVADNGLQGALMVPTEVLARQHYATIKNMIQENEISFEVILLTGSMTAKQKREAYEKIDSGTASIVIGTHALIQEKVHYKNLALVITDEQHRFGVKQRELLSLKGEHPHTIVMSATPIPRTLAVILYGDLDISVINEMPSSRLPVKNCVVGKGYRKKAYEFIQKQVEKGHQAYIICPMVEESEAIDAENVIEYTEMLRNILPGKLQIDYLHGRMKPLEKNEIMERFLKNEIQVLVSTTVVEVGVNVPNATVMMIENAERFGLAQLHQLRGRVGRGSDQSYCIFLHAAEGNKIRERLDILCKSNDGFEIANRDMQLRGPGDLFGIRQSGMLDFTLADIYIDAAVLQEANEAVSDLLERDPEFAKEEHQELKKRYNMLMRTQTDHLNL